MYLTGPVSPESLQLQQGAPRPDHGRPRTARHRPGPGTEESQRRGERHPVREGLGPTRTTQYLHESLFFKINEGTFLFMYDPLPHILHLSHLQWKSISFTVLLCAWCDPPSPQTSSSRVTRSSPTVNNCQPRENIH